MRNEELLRAHVPGGGAGVLLWLRLLRMVRRHGTVDEIENHRHEGQGDENAPEKEFAGMRWIVFEE